MSDQVNWSLPTRVMRGCVIDGEFEAQNDEAFERAFAESWRRLADVISKLAQPDLNLQVAVEVWQDTGRVIFIARQKRDIVRIVLQCKEIERLYFSYDRTDDTTFDELYSAQHRRIVACLGRSCDLTFIRTIGSVLNSADLSVCITDADDAANGEAILLT